MVKPATHAYYITVKHESGNVTYEAYIPAMTKLGYRVHHYTDHDNARDRVKQWYEENLRFGGYGG